MNIGGAMSFVSSTRFLKMVFSKQLIVVFRIEINVMSRTEGNREIST